MKRALVDLAEAWDFGRAALWSDGARCVAAKAAAPNGARGTRPAHCATARQAAEWSAEKKRVDAEIDWLARAERHESRKAGSSALARIALVGLAGCRQVQQQVAAQEQALWLHSMGQIQEDVRSMRPQPSSSVNVYVIGGGIVPRHAEQLQSVYGGGREARLFFCSLAS
jgi:hypothetical protein